MTIEELLAQSAAQLVGVGIQNARQEAGWLLAHVLGHSPIAVPVCGSERVPREKVECFQELLVCRLAGEPLQYIIGSTEFYGLELAVGPGVLIPRPETERLVDFAVELCPSPGSVCDLCTGSGAVALALAHELGENVEVTAVDISEKALAYARRNAESLALDHVEFLLGDLFGPVPPDARFDVVTANPPYVSPSAYNALPEEVRAHEPRLALWADDCGLALVRRIAEEARHFLSPHGYLLCEISSEQGAGAVDLLTALGYTQIEVRKDYTGRDRVVVGRCERNAEY
ncbi:MAG: peptide chain release factor N(5)-glutamine methyltransferase [Lentisphaeria bacterium]|nr:peptide chain release factor N(5)-glutamine methyltransferase [Lentisphaeria bacterium]